MTNTNIQNNPIIIYGFHSIESAIINDPKGIKSLWLNKERKDKRISKLYDLIKKSRLPSKLVNKKFLDEKVGDAKHQGVAALYQSTKTLTELHIPELLKKEDVFLLILDNIEDPHNLGACLRSANAAGVDAVIAPKHKAVTLTPAVRKIASGAAESTPFIQVSNISSTIEKLKESKVWCIGTTGESKKSIYDIDLKGRLAIVM